MRTTVILTMLLLVAAASAAFGQVGVKINNNAYYATPVLNPADSVVQVSDQKAGSILVFPFYKSGANSDDTRITISHVGPQGIAPTAAPAPFPGAGAVGTPTGNLASVYVHMFWMDNTCSQADAFICLTPGASEQFKASAWDPNVTGLIIAVAVDPEGYPISYNGLIGNAFVNVAVGTDRWVGNYGAESFASLGTQLAAPVAGIQSYFYSTASNPTNGFTSADITFSNGPRSGQPGYDAAPNSFAADFSSPADSIGQAILTVSLFGNIGPVVDPNTGLIHSLTGNAFSGLGQVYRGTDEANLSFTGPANSSCQQITTITATNPRVPFQLGNFIGTGKVGTITWNTVGGAVGLMVTPLQPGNGLPAGGFYGIRTLHKRNVYVGGLAAPILNMPVFVPTCI